MGDAAGYSRVSTEEQKKEGYSLQEQAIQINKDCIQKDNSLVRCYEDHCSGKNFNRPQFQKFLKDVKTKAIKVDRLIVTKIDRFSRDVYDCIYMVKTLRDLGIKVYSIAEGEIDFTNAHTFFPNLILSGAAQYENILKSDNTIRGMRQAQRQGKWVSTAPYGYKSDKINKEIVINDVTAEIVREAFNTFSKGLYSAEEVRKALSYKGLKLSKQGFLNMLKNPAYCGKIRMKKYKDEPEEIVPGQHEVIITQEEFDVVQKVLKGGRNTSSKGTLRKDTLPLRGYLYCCRCSKKLTGSASTSQNKSKHHYYHCQNGCNERFRADEANELFIKYLESFEISKPVVELYKAILEDVFKQDDVTRNMEKNKIEKELLIINERINNITDKFTDGQVDTDTFHSTKKRYQDSKEELLFRLKSLSPEMASYKKYMSFGILLIENLSKFYKFADLPTKQRLVGSIFKNKITFDKKNYRTNEVNEFLGVIGNTTMGFEKSKNKKVGKNADLSTMAPPSGLEPETL